MAAQNYAMNNHSIILWSDWAKSRGINLENSDDESKDDKEKGNSYSKLDGDDDNEDGKEKIKEYSYAKKLQLEEMAIYGSSPYWDELSLVICNKCCETKQKDYVVKPQALERHFRLNHNESIPRPSGNELSSTPKKQSKISVNKTTPTQNSNNSTNHSTTTSSKNFKDFSVNSILSNNNVLPKPSTVQQVNGPFCNTNYLVPVHDNCDSSETNVLSVSPSINCPRSPSDHKHNAFRKMCNQIHSATTNSSQYVLNGPVYPFDQVNSPYWKTNELQNHNSTETHNFCDQSQLFLDRKKILQNSYDKAQEKPQDLCTRTQTPIIEQFHLNERPQNITKNTPILARTIIEKTPVPSEVVHSPSERSSPISDLDSPSPKQSRMTFLHVRPSCDHPFLADKPSPQPLLQQKTRHLEHALYQIREVVDKVQTKVLPGNCYAFNEQSTVTSGSLCLSPRQGCSNLLSAATTEAVTNYTTTGGCHTSTGCQPSSQMQCSLIKNCDQNKNCTSNTERRGCSDNIHCSPVLLNTKANITPNGPLSSPENDAYDLIRMDGFSQFKGKPFLENRPDITAIDTPPFEGGSIPVLESKESKHSTLTPPPSLEFDVSSNYIDLPVETLPKVTDSSKICPESSIDYNLLVSSETENELELMSDDADPSYITHFPRPLIKCCYGMQKFPDGPIFINKRFVATRDAFCYLAHKEGEPESSMMRLLSFMPCQPLSPEVKDPDCSRSGKLATAEAAKHNTQVPHLSVSPNVTLTNSVPKLSPRVCSTIFEAPPKQLCPITDDLESARSPPTKRKRNTILLEGTNFSPTLTKKKETSKKSDALPQKSHAKNENTFEINPDPFIKNFSRLMRHRIVQDSDLIAEITNYNKQNPVRTNRPSLKISDSSRHLTKSLSFLSVATGKNKYCNKFNSIHHAQNTPKKKRRKVSRTTNNLTSNLCDINMQLPLHGITSNSLNLNHVKHLQRRLISNPFSHLGCSSPLVPLSSSHHSGSNQTLRQHSPMCISPRSNTCSSPKSILGGNDVSHSPLSSECSTSKGRTGKSVDKTLPESLPISNAIKLTSTFPFALPVTFSKKIQNKRKSCLTSAGRTKKTLTLRSIFSNKNIINRVQPQLKHDQKKISSSKTAEFSLKKFRPTILSSSCQVLKLLPSGLSKKNGVSNCDSSFSVQET